MTFRRKFISREALGAMGIPVMYQGITWDNYRFPNKSLEKLLKGYTEHCDKMLEDGINLLLVGGQGNGKTYISSIILQYCYARYYTTRLTTFKSLITKTFENQDCSEFYNTQFLVIDELGAEVNLKSGAEKSLIEELLKYRFTKGLPTIICSNLTLDELKTRYGNTFFSMLSEFVRVEIVGQDGRQGAFRKKKALEYLR